MTNEYESLVTSRLSLRLNLILYEHYFNNRKAAKRPLCFKPYSL